MNPRNLLPPECVEALLRERLASTSFVMEMGMVARRWTDGRLHTLRGEVAKGVTHPIYQEWIQESEADLREIEQDLELLGRLVQEARDSKDPGLLGRDASMAIGRLEGQVARKVPEPQLRPIRILYGNPGPPGWILEPEEEEEEPELDTEEIDVGYDEGDDEETPLDASLVF